MNECIPYDRRLAESGRPIKWRDGSGFLIFIAADDYGGLVCRDPADMQLINPTKHSICMAGEDETGPMPEMLFQSVIVPLVEQIKQARERMIEDVMNTGGFARDIRFKASGLRVEHIVHADGGATYYVDEVLQLE